MTGLVAVAVGVMIFAASYLALTACRRAAMRRRMNAYAPVAAKSSARARVDRDSLVDAFERLLGRLGVRRRVVAVTERAAVDVKAGVLVLLDLGLALVAFAFVATRASTGAALLAGLVGGALPWIALVVKGQRRSRAFENQLPEVLDTLSASLRAGHGFDAALQTVATDVAEPAAREFRRVVTEVHLGRSLEDALSDLGDRIRSTDLKFVLDAIVIQRQVGGSLAELFELVAETVRSREQFRWKVRALTGMVRMSANVLTALPFATALLLTLVNHEYMSALWTTPAGFVLVGVAVTMLTVGSLVLRRIGSVKC
jgi:tight adherence protein B